MITDALTLTPFSLYTGMSLFIPVLVWILTRSFKAFRRTLYGGLGVIIAMLVAPHFTTISESPGAYVLSGVTVLGFLAMAFLVATSNNNLPLWIIGLYAWPTAIVSWIALAQIMALGRCDAGASCASNPMTTPESVLVGLPSGAPTSSLSG